MQLHCTGELADFIAGVKEELATAFIVSQVELADGEGGQFTGEVEGLGVTVCRADGEKCERCWMFSETVGSDPDHPTLCQRCAAIVK